MHTLRKFREQVDCNAKVLFLNLVCIVRIVLANQKLNFSDGFDLFLQKVSVEFDRVKRYF